MCGIIAILPIDQKNPLPSILKKMGDTIRHRGPDDEGYAFFNSTEQQIKTNIYGGEDTPDDIFQSNLPYCPNATMSGDENNNYTLALGHRRLSIIDLFPTGHQPMSYRGRYWIVYNGELYNYLEIREELEKKGHSFLSHSDTEVILASYAEWGRACLDYFNGMWSFLLFDSEKSILFGSCDRFGIKPLYYWINEKNYIAFASEIKAFTDLPDWNPILNNKIAYDFLIHGILDHTDETFFTNVRKLRGGESFLMDISNHDKVIQKYNWYVKPKIRYKKDFNTSTRDLKRCLYDAVKIHLRSDVAVGSCLSGGLDSSTIVCIIRDILSTIESKGKQENFSAYSIDKRVDESDYITEVNHWLGIEGKFVFPDVNDLFKDLPNIIWHQDEPFGSTSIFAQWSVFLLAKKNGVKVLLDGQGADEILGGYHPFLCIYQGDLLLKGKFPRFIREFIKSHHLYGLPMAVQMRDVLYFLLLNSELGRRVLQVKRKKIIEPLWLNNKILVDNPSLPPQTTLGDNPDYVTAYCHFSTYVANLPALLHYEDRNSMAHSIESRVPFLDYRLVEFLLSIPPEYKLRDGWTKCILRKSMKEVLPEKIRLRKDKIGFATSEELWMKNEKRIEFRDLLMKAVNSSHGIINDKAVQLFDKMTSNEIIFDHMIWRILVFGLWMDIFHVNIDTDIKRG